MEQGPPTNSFFASLRNPHNCAFVPIHATLARFLRTCGGQQGMLAFSSRRNRAPADRTRSQAAPRLRSQTARPLLPAPLHRATSLTVAQVQLVQNKASVTSFLSERCVRSTPNSFGTQTLRKKVGGAPDKILNPPQKSDCSRLATQAQAANSRERCVDECPIAAA